MKKLIFLILSFNLFIQCSDECSKKMNLLGNHIFNLQKLKGYFENPQRNNDLYLFMLVGDMDEFNELKKRSEPFIEVLKRYDNLEEEALFGLKQDKFDMVVNENDYRVVSSLVAEVKTFAQKRNEDF